MAVSAVASTSGTSTAIGDVVVAVVPVLTNSAGIQINPDGGRLRMRRPDGSEYSSVALMQDSVGGSTMTFIKIPA